MWRGECNVDCVLEQRRGGGRSSRGGSGGTGEDRGQRGQKKREVGAGRARDIMGWLAPCYCARQPLVRAGRAH